MHFVAEELPEDIVVDRQAILREDRVTELLELFEDFVVHAGIVVIGAAQQDDAEPVFALELFEHFAGGAAHGDVVEDVEGAIALFDGAMIFFRRQAKDVLELFVHLALENIGVGEVDEGVDEADALLFEEIAFLGERSLDRRRRGGDGGAGTAGLQALEIAGEAVDHREEDDIERLLGVDLVEQIVDVRDAELRGEAGIDGAALGAFFVQFFASCSRSIRGSRP